jgi:hypothetical protein
MRRREYIAGAGLVGIGSLAGCVDFLLGDEPAEFSAEPARVREDALTETGYQFDDRTTFEIEREFEVAGESRTVIVTNSRANYDKSISAGPLEDVRGALFTVLTTRQASVLDQEFNPVAALSSRRLLELVQSSQSGFDGLEYQEEGTATVYGTDTTQNIFIGTVTFGEQSVDVRIHITDAVEMDDDLAVTVGVYPELVPAEEENIYRLMGAIMPGE